MVGSATLTTVPSSIAMLDPSTVAAITHRPWVLVSRMAPGAGEAVATTPSIFSSRRPHCPARQAARVLVRCQWCGTAGRCPGERDVRALHGPAAGVLDRRRLLDHRRA